MRPASGLPGRGALRDMTTSRATVGVVTKYYAPNGRPVVDVQVGARTFTAVPLQTTEGGGGPDRYAHFSIRTDPIRPIQVNPDGTKAAQVRLEFDGETGAPRAVGVVQHPDLGLVQSVVTPTATQDRATGVTADDHALANGGALFIVDSRGAIVFDVASAEDGNVRVQLPTAGFLRISRGGAADDKPASGAAVTDEASDWRSFATQLLAALNAAVTSGPTLTFAPAAPLPTVPTSRPMKLSAIQVPADVEA